MNKKLKKFLKFLGLGILFQVAIVIVVNVFFVLFNEPVLLAIAALAYLYLIPVTALIFGSYAAILLAMGNIKEKDNLKESAALWGGLFASAALPWILFYLIFGGQ
jgi:hypothetical protein